LSGTETYVLGLHKTEDNLELAKRENEVILMEENYKKTYKGYDPNSPLAHIMMSNFQNAFMKQGISLASKVEKQVTKKGHKSRGVKQAGFIVLWQTSMPAVLVETGYITNTSDRNFLSSENGKEKIAEAIFQALKAYKEEVEKK
jgi:N-acetylmuramoyl-L-alanine amidase